MLERGTAPNAAAVIGWRAIADLGFRRDADLRRTASTAQASPISMPPPSGAFVAALDSPPRPSHLPRRHPTTDHAVQPSRRRFTRRRLPQARRGPAVKAAVSSGHFRMRDGERRQVLFEDEPVPPARLRIVSVNVSSSSSSRSSAWGPKLKTKPRLSREVARSPRRRGFLQQDDRQTSLGDEGGKR
jgi:hypothetical protein